MKAVPEPGQSQASADALERLMEASRAAQHARVMLKLHREEGRRMAKEAKRLEALAEAADREYLATPYAAP